MAEKKIFVISLSGAKQTSKYKHTPRAAKIVKEFLARHMKSDVIKLDSKLNESLWERGVSKPPTKIRVKAVKDDDGVVTASLVE